MFIDKKSNASTRRQKPGYFGRHVGWLQRYYAQYTLREQVKKERKALIMLSDEILYDIGITRAQALQEGRRASDDLRAERLSRIYS